MTNDVAKAIRQVVEVNKQILEANTQIAETVRLLQVRLSVMRYLVMCLMHDRFQGGDDPLAALADFRQRSHKGFTDDWVNAEFLAGKTAQVDLSNDASIEVFNEILDKIQEGLKAGPDEFNETVH